MQQQRGGKYQKDEIEKVGGTKIRGRGMHYDVRETNCQSFSRDLFMFVILSLCDGDECIISMFHIKCAFQRVFSDENV